MKFRFGGTKPETTDEMHEKFFEGTRKFATETLGWEVPSTVRIRKISFVHDGKHEVAEIDGQMLGETVLAILKSNAYLVCTMNRGVARGMPILVGTNEVESIDYFDGFKDAYNDY